MAKVPVAGRVKTRLAKGVGVVRATAFFRHTARAVLGRIGSSPHWQTIIAVSPDHARLSRAFPAGIARTPQGGGDLGARLARAIDRQPPGPVVVVGLDIPEITAAPIRKAFSLLGSNDAVFGAADDGGYWLVGLRRRPCSPRIFGRVRWSSEHALADTLANLAGKRVAMTGTLGDVDEAADLTKLEVEPGRRILPVAARHDCDWIRDASGRLGLSRHLE
ncbi:MAG TPA: TIGR04282 family arsenosugar biosynthesis glycosyltransferase [Hyphomicrobiaceae bacterium]|nr:TIGR04282 family arsenosugar biosynthesis glycosyltransferase [Hyphomicrobiaceae bacterium]